MKRDPYEEEARKQSVREELRALELKKKASWKNPKDLCRAGHGQMKKTVFWLIQGFIFLFITLLAGHLYIIPFFNESTFLPYFIMLLLLVLLHLLAFVIKKLWEQ
ncbi:hypothetical protein [Isachenkonia alkalipeptolytica]|uniref:Uncharacterized protein n=1 Tax=Isachenkonia alkalipeptolytica TaxID=2565777 RepID=A0AA43XJE7_9CLOT|nr:hypothetical protein [Isachenkonia alkalipeptolytica]NBG87857.1 hypothetical protein [Isachenkonia alkalipeptolytica]